MPTPLEDRAVKNVFHIFKNCRTAGTRAVLVLAPLTAGFLLCQVRDTTPLKATPDYYRMKKAVLMDNIGFERPMPALTLLIPTDWKFQGNVQWREVSGCTTRIAQTPFAASSADGRHGITLYTPYFWQYASTPGYRTSMEGSNRSRIQVGKKPCDVMPPMGAAEFLRRLAIPRYRPGTQVVAIEPVPDLLLLAQENARKNEANAARSGNPMKSSVDVARARLRYIQNGVAMEEWFTVIVYANVRTLTTLSVTTYDCGAYYMYALRAPQGELTAREKLFRLITRSVQLDPNWNARANGVAANIFVKERDATHDRQMIDIQTREEVNRIRKEGADNQQRADEIARFNNDQYIRGVETYRNPETGKTMELSNQYGHAWENRQGEFVLTDHPNFDPNVEFQETGWNKLEHVVRR